MAKKSDSLRPLIWQLTHYLYARREAILNNWRTLCAADTELQVRSSFSREEFNDQVPVLLNILAQRLLEEPVETDPVERAGQHGLHRWQRGYSFRELLNELNLFYRTLHAELEQYLQRYPDTPAQLVLLVSQQLLWLSNEANFGSVIYYDDLRQTSAAEQVQTLHSALDQLHQVTKQRSDHLRETTHDLRGNFGLVSNAASILKLPLEEEHRQRFLDMLGRNLTTTHYLLDQLADYARLEAGQEQLVFQSFDAAELLRELVAGAQHFAKERKLALWADGPEHLLVKSDPLKVKRIVQNLMINALKYTQSGWVSVSWGADNDTRWLVSVQDTGPGLTEGPVGMLAEQLKPLSEPTSAQQSGGPEEYPSEAIPETHAHSAAKTQLDGEGIGLFIVKRLCELLKASMDIETSPGRGTLIRIRLLSNSHLAELG